MTIAYEVLRRRRDESMPPIMQAKGYRPDL